MQRSLDWQSEDEDSSVVSATNPARDFGEITVLCQS